ncbi:hypothetical protein [Candidatus Palauibacter sp.]
MATDALRAQIAQAVRAFENGSLRERAKDLLCCLGYESERTFEVGPRGV